MEDPGATGEAEVTPRETRSGNTGPWGGLGTMGKMVVWCLMVRCEHREGEVLGAGGVGDL